MLKKNLGLSLLIAGASVFLFACQQAPQPSPTTNGSVTQIRENLVFSLDKNQAATCTAPANFTATLLHEHHVKKRQYVFAENSPYSDVVSTGRVPFDPKRGSGSFDDKITLKDSSRILYIHGIVETVKDDGKTTFKKYGTWYDNQHCQGTFVDSVQEQLPKVAQVACGN